MIKSKPENYTDINGCNCLLTIQNLCFLPNKPKITATFSISTFNGITHKAPNKQKENFNKPNRYSEKDFITPNMYIQILTAPMNAHRKSITPGQGIGKKADKNKLDDDNGMVTQE